MLALSRLSHRIAVKSRAAISRTAYRLRTRDDGVAAVEFALIAPIMAVMLIGAIEMSGAVTIDRRVSQVAATTGDLTARFDGSITPADVEEIKNIGSWILGIKTAAELNSRLTVTLRLVTVQCQPGDTCANNALVPTNYAGQRTRWQCEFGPGKTNGCFCNNSGNGDAFETPRTGLVEFNTSPAIVVSDVEYRYTPMFFDTFMGQADSSATIQSGDNLKSFKLTERLYHKPRGAEIKINPNGTTTSGSNTCNL
jgi:Flp pilus assembly protein TadG